MKCIEQPLSHCKVYSNTQYVVELHDSFSSSEDMQFIVVECAKKHREKDSKQSHSITLLFTVWTISGLLLVYECRLGAMPCQAIGQSPPFFIALACDEFTPVPSRPQADGAVQPGVAPAATAACQTGGRRPGCAKRDHTVEPYGNSVHSTRWHWISKEYTPWFWRGRGSGNGITITADQTMECVWAFPGTRCCRRCPKSSDHGRPRSPQPQLQTCTVHQDALHNHLRPSESNKGARAHTLACPLGCPLQMMMMACVWEVNGYLLLATFTLDYSGGPKSRRCRHNSRTPQPSVIHTQSSSSIKSLDAF